MKKIVVFLVALFCVQMGFAQSNESFAGEIAAFKHQDSVNFPPKHAILFVGSSSFRKWKDVQSYFPDCTIINRGFGGSQLENVIYYAPQIIYPYEPKQVIIYCGDNDFAYDESVSAKVVFERFEKLFSLIRMHLPKANIGFVSIKFSPSRKQFWNKMKETNSLVNSFLSKQKNAEFIDVTKDMKDADGNERTDIYQSDMLHLKPAGYKIWQKDIQPYLLK
ncbi:G-D-S-L family lipolytic protein [Arachidicoccus ginsenosidimutans]|uniref:GDSL-type esterase/lipase family protein n=1 Tax=Arachidicoccus sp. BS20 TaxID=1850526 RepID=UPI0007F0D836|nr:GDSL-type esterase/lipase family protein [Arachidicoccus sp. BS20]ANI88983.1 G-D-S-L family lipolytic protein [Arachidicoccus sp. BS20]